MLNTLETIARSVPQALATACQGAGHRAWEKEFTRRLRLRGFTVQPKARVASRGDGTDRGGYISLLVINPVQDDSQPRFTYVQVENTQVKAKTRSKLQAAARLHHFALRMVIVLYQPFDPTQAPILNCPEANVVVQLHIPHPIDWPDEVLTKARQASKTNLQRLGYGGRGGRAFSHPDHRARSNRPPRK